MGILNECFEDFVLWWTIICALRRGSLMPKVHSRVPRGSRQSSFSMSSPSLLASNLYIRHLQLNWHIFALCILSNAKNTEYKNRIFNSGRGLLVCDSIESCLSIHRSAASFLSQYTGIIDTHPKKTKCQIHKTSSAVVVTDGNQEIGKSVANSSFASLVEASGWWSNKTSRWQRWLTFEYFRLLSPQAQFSAQLHSIV